MFVVVGGACCLWMLFFLCGVVVVRGLSFVVRSRLFGVCCVLFIVCCLLFVVWRLSLFGLCVC